MSTTVDLAGWDTRLTQLCAGLDLDQPADRAYLAARLAGATDAGTLRALARWLGFPSRAADRDQLARHVADAWEAEQRQRARAAAGAGRGFDRVPAPADDQPF